MFNPIVIAALAASFISSGPSASSICSALDHEPTVEGVAVVGLKLMDTYDAKTAATIIVTAVQGSCPEYIPLLVKFGERYGG